MTKQEAENTALKKAESTALLRAEKLYEKVQTCCRSGYVVVIEHPDGEKSFKFILITPFRDNCGNYKTSTWANSIDNALLEIGYGFGFTEKEMIHGFLVENWQIVKTIHILDLIEGSKVGDRVKTTTTGLLHRGIVTKVLQPGKRYEVSFDDPLRCISLSSYSKDRAVGNDEIAPYFEEEPIETTEYEGVTYNKKEFEEAVKDLKPIK